VLNRDVLYLKDEIEAENAIAGYMIVHDLSERDFQLNREGQWVKGKSCPGFSPVGPYLLTRDEIENAMNLQMGLKVNGEVRQSGNTSTMVFNPAYLIWYISQFMKLEAGDLISTGTPPGVGLGMKPPQYLKDGDVVQLSIEHLGSQKQQFIAYK
jgi:2,4-diketo-3-deoxy-L-fuconate hydrolase